MQDKGFHKINSFKRIYYDTLHHMRDKHTITTSLWQELSDMRMYMDTMDAKNNGWIMPMTPEEWVTMDIMTLRLNHVTITTAMSNPPEPSIDATNVTLPKKETTNFLKYVSVVLTDKSQFLKF